SRHARRPALPSSTRDLGTARVGLQGGARVIGRGRSPDALAPVPNAAGALATDTTRLPSFPVGFFALTLVAVTSRGLFEILIGKNLAYAVQAGAVVLFAVALVTKNRPRAGRRLPLMLLLFWLLLLAAIISVWATSADGA